jgi:rod shape determining protein RodA
MRRRIDIWSNMDWFTVTLYLLLIIMGWLNIYSAVYNEEHQSIFDFSQRYGKQLIWIVASIVLAAIIMMIDSNFYSFFSYTLYGIILFLLIAVLFFGTEIHGAKAWFTFGNIRFQPAEFAKITTALAISKYLSTFNVKLNTYKTYFRVALIIFLPFVLVFIQDAGTALVFLAFMIPLYREGLSSAVLLLGVYIIILFILSFLVDKIFLAAGTILIAMIILWIVHKKFRYVFYAVLIFLASAGLLWIIHEIANLNIPFTYIFIAGFIFASIFYFILAYWYKISRVFILFVFVLFSIGFTNSVDYVFNNFLKSHQQTRIMQIMGLEENPQGAGYNVNQSKIAIGSGGLTGKGYLKGTQTKFDFVPEQSTDFIFSTIGEEWGFIGSFMLIALFATFLLRLIYLAERQRAPFSRIYGYGVLSVFLVHFAINIGMTIGLVPVIGIPLPFISYGGSSLWAFTIMLFIFLKLDVSRLKELR